LLAFNPFFVESKVTQLFGTRKLIGRINQSNSDNYAIFTRFFSSQIRFEPVRPQHPLAAGLFQCKPVQGIAVVEPEFFVGADLGQPDAVAGAVDLHLEMSCAEVNADYGPAVIHAGVLERQPGVSGIHPQRIAEERPGDFEYLFLFHSHIMKTPPEGRV